VVGLTFVAVVAALLIRFSFLVPPLLMALIISYVLHPLVSRISRVTRLSWRAAVNLIYLLLLVSLLAMLTASGVAAIQQIQSLYRTVEAFVRDLPNFITDLSTRVFVIAGYTIDMQQILGQYDLEQVLNQVVGIIQPALGQAGSLVGSLASSTVSALGWGLFILLISYFLLADAGHLPDMLSGSFSQLDLPGYREDLSRLGKSLGRIWSSFMRGQLILFVITILTVTALLTVLGVRNVLALALLSGVARFIPYVGPLIVWVVAGMVAFFQPDNYFGLPPGSYSLLVVGAMVVLDQIFDNLVTPKLYGQTLGVHPAAVLVAAIVAANLLGFIGLLLAAPVLATLILFGRYAFRKMQDMDPWDPGEPDPAGMIEFPGMPLFRRIYSRLRARLRMRRLKDEQS
jgi:predicted PurR-regulated permease PerM